MNLLIISEDGEPLAPALEEGAAQWEGDHPAGGLFLLRHLYWLDDSDLTCLEEAGYLEGVDGVVLQLSGRMTAREVVSRVREAVKLPFLVLGRENSYFEEIQCLQGGADDYQRKEIPDTLLLLRMQRLFRLYQGQTAGFVVKQDFVEYLSAGEIYWGKRNLHLTPKEYQVFHWLLHGGAEIVSREQLLYHVWNDASGTTKSRALDAVLVKIRQKLRGTGWSVKTCFGRGFQLVRSREGLSVPQEAVCPKEKRGKKGL